MLKSVLVVLLLTLSGVQAAPIATLKGMPKTIRLFDDSQQNNIFGHLPVLKQGLDQNLIEGQTEHWLEGEVPNDVTAQRIGGGWVQVEEPSYHLPDGFRQGIEPFSKIPDDFRQGTEPSLKIKDSFRQGTEPFMRISDGFRQGTEPFMRIPDGFRQGTEPFMWIPDGSRQGTEPIISSPEGVIERTEAFMPMLKTFRQRNEPVVSILDSVKQGTDSFLPITDGFRHGKEPFFKSPDGFGLGTEPFLKIPDDLRQGTNPFLPTLGGFIQGQEDLLPFLDGFRQETEPSRSIVGFRKGPVPVISIPDRKGTEMVVEKEKRQVSQRCKGEVIYGKCYELNLMRLAFKEAQALCKSFNPQSELASITSRHLHSRLVSMVTNSGEQSTQLTWLGATVKNQQASWLDGSEMNYSDWMPGQPNIHTDKPICVEMFKIDKSWWTVADCDKKRASICSYPINA
ncbi:uncharacterized protein LOC144202302 [Stigmatopora nigra]